MNDETTALREGAETSSARAEDALTRIPIADVVTDAAQPRRGLGSLEGLKASIRQHGILQPIVVSPAGGGRYKIVAGHRRFAAATQLGLKTVPAVVRTVAEHERLELQLIENIHRLDLNPVEEARSLRGLMADHNLTQAELSKRLGKSVATINQTLRVLSLPGGILRELETHEPPSKSVLLEIAKAPSADAQLKLWELAKKGLLTVKRARDRVHEKRSVSRRVRLDWATVTVRFRKGTFDATDDAAQRRAMQKALQQALARQ
jgi:ParB family chromosome partitioning protein